MGVPNTFDSSSVPDLKLIASRQKGIIYCILANLAMGVLALAAPPSLKIVIFLGMLILGITQTVFVFLLATVVYSTGMGIVLGIFSLIPYIGLIPLLIVNSKATNILRAHKIKVGLLGAKGI